jgi:hypothetical protein
MIERLGNVLYWTATAAAIFWIGMSTYAEATSDYPFEWGTWASVGLGFGGLVWLAGRAIRYVLAAK